MATLEEMDRHWDLVEVWDANEVLDLQDEANRRTVEPKG